MAMRKVTCLLAMVAAAGTSLPAMAQSPNSAVGGAQTSQAQVAQPPDDNVNWKGVGVGAGTVAGNILYVPAKMVYGILGGITGGASYLLTGGNTQTANTIWRSSLGGDYVLTPDMITGQQPVHFSGPTTTPPEPAQPITSAAPAGSSAMNSTPIQSAPANRTASADLGGPVNSAPIAGNTTAVSQPADRGTGPVNTGGSISGNSTGRPTNSGVSAPPLPSSIE
jgi:hypothetical protein